MAKPFELLMTFAIFISGNPTVDSFLKYPNEQDIRVSPLLLSPWHFLPGGLD
jgi:hypothetical protein